MQFQLIDEVRRERAERACMAAAEEAEARALNSPMARLAAGATVDVLTLTDEELDSIFPAAVFAAVLVDMVRLVERHQKGAIAQKTT